MITKKADIIIIGAGLTGLSMAYFLKKNGRKPLLLEKSGRPGGVINTYNDQDFIYESGPNTGVLANKEIVSLFDDLKEYCTLETGNKDSKKRYIMKNSKWHALPSGFFSAISTPLFTLKDKFRILGEPFRKPGSNPDESVAEMVIRRLGKSYLDYAVDPFISGIYAGDPEKLVTRYALPKLYNLEHNYGSFIKGSYYKNREKKSEEEKKVTREIFSASGGLINLINALEKNIGLDCIKYNTENLTTDSIPSGFSVYFSDNNGVKYNINTRTLISTVGSYCLTDIFPFLPVEKVSPILNLKYAGIIQVAAGFTNWSGPPLDAFGGLIPSKENKNILGILFPSAIFKNRAPENGALLSVFLGGIKNNKLINENDDNIKSIVLNEIKNSMLNNDKPGLLRIFRYKYAIPQYEKSSGLRIESIKKIQEDYPGLILAGNIRDGIGMADRVKQARDIADLLKNK